MFSEVFQAVDEFFHRGPDPSEFEIQKACEMMGIRRDYRSVLKKTKHCEQLISRAVHVHTEQ